jgi:hypothetical protein
MGLSNEPALRAAFRKDTWIRKEFAMVDWQKALDGPEAYFPASSPGPFIAPTVRMPRFTKRSFVTSTPSDTACQIVIPYLLLLFLTIAVAVLAWIRVLRRLTVWAASKRFKLNGMPRFTIKDLLIATTLVAVGAGLIAFWMRTPELDTESWLFLPALVVCWYGGGAFIGAGLFIPFKRPLTGVFIAVVIQTLLGIVIIR